MRLRGKDYCNCDHAQLLRKAIVEACKDLRNQRPDEAYIRLENVLDADHAACMDLWGDLKESEIGK